MHSVILSVGSNIRNRLKNILKALHILGKEFYLKDFSSIYRTEPWKMNTEKKFLNLALEILIPENITPLQLLTTIKEIEKWIGRKYRGHWKDREIDIDIIFFDNIEYKDELLTIPHRFYKERNFVLIPIVEMKGPDFTDPYGKKLVEYISEEKGKVELKIEKIVLKELLKAFSSNFEKQLYNL